MAGLTALQVKNAKQGRHADGRGLYLVVRGGSRAWVARVQVHGKRRDFSLGLADSVSLERARIEAAELRRRYKAGEEIISARAVAAPVENEAAIPSFEAAARVCHEAMKGGWRNKRHVDSCSPVNKAMLVWAWVNRACGPPRSTFGR